MLVIFDKDGTLTTPKSGAKFVQHPEDQVLIPGTDEMVAKLSAEGAAIAIASNQGGCSAINPATGKPYKTLEDAIDEAIYLNSLLPEATIDYIFLAHSYDFMGYGECVKIDFTDGGLTWKIMTNAQQRFRKPAPGMINYAKLLTGETEAVMIGDRPEDEQAAQAAGVRFQWIWDVNLQYPQELRGK